MFLISPYQNPMGACVWHIIPVATQKAGRLLQGCFLLPAASHPAQEHVHGNEYKQLAVAT